MGPERILQAARGRLIAAALGVAVAIPADAAPRERVAVIDLGPADGGAIRRGLAGTIVAGGFEAVNGDGIDDALAGEAIEADATLLQAALDEAQRAFGALDCKAATAAAKTAIGIAAARQAAGLAVTQLPRAWAYVVLCADRAGDVDAAMHATASLRTVGGSPDVPADVLAKYPEVDTMLDREVFPLSITTDEPGAEIWIDFQPAGSAPLDVKLSAGEHWIAAAKGTKRGWAQGVAAKKQTALVVPLVDRASPASAIAARVASWKGAMPSAAELAAVLDLVHARVALVRRGSTLEAWGHIGKSESPRRLGGEDGTGTIAEADRLVALIHDRVQTWNDRAPDPDQPLLVEDPKERARRKAGKTDEPAKWWVYAAIVGAAAIGGTVLYLHDTASDTQRVELHYP